MERFTAKQAKQNLDNHRAGLYKKLLPDALKHIEVRSRLGEEKVFVGVSNFSLKQVETFEEDLKELGFITHRVHRNDDLTDICVDLDSLN